jgi:hypothetical protein
MQRNLKMARIYKLGDFENLTVEDTVMDIPDNLALDETFLRKVQYIQMVRIESMAFKYYKLRQEFRTMTLEETLAILENTALELGDGLKEYLTVKTVNSDDKKKEG